MLESHQQSYQQQVFSFISSVIGQKNIIPVPVEFVHFIGDYNTAALLNQIIYWTDRTKDPEGWFYKSYANWHEELALSKYQVNRAAGVLKSMKLIETQVKKVNGDPTLHYRLDTDVFINLFGKHLQERNKNNNQLQSTVSQETSLTKVKELNLPKSNFLTNIIITETTSKNTTETKPAPSSPTLPETTSPPPSFSSEPKKKIIPKELYPNREIPLPDFYDHDVKDLMQSIPESKRSKAVEKVIEQALLNHGVDDVKSAIAYTLKNSNGNKQQFKAYLGKTLENSWFEGYEPETANSYTIRLRESDQAEEKARAEIKAKHEALNSWQSTHPEEYKLMEQQAATELGYNLKRLKPGQGMNIKFKVMQLMGL